MQEILTVKKGSAFIKRYYSELLGWATYLNLTASEILTISRKGPRLIELLFNDGLINKKTLNSCYTEYAIPFIKDANKITIVDDSVLYGTTLTKTIAAVKKFLSLKVDNIDIVPFRYSTDTPDEVKVRLNRTISKALLPEESANYIGSLISSFKSLGKPYDVEHPIIYLHGDFTDIELLKVRLAAFSKLLSNNSLIEIENYNYPKSFTILVNGCSSREKKELPEFSKFRIYLNQDLSQLAIVPISPCVIQSDDLATLEHKIDKNYQKIWKTIYESVSIKEDEDFYLRSLVIFANYLNSFSLFLNNLQKFKNYFDISKIELKQFDLQLLLGFDLSTSITIDLNLLLKTDLIEIYKTTPAYSGKLKDFILPAEYASEYNNFFDEKIEVLKTLKSESEILNSIFYSQHCKIELKSREKNNYNFTDRLKFGFSLHHLITIIEAIIPNYSIENVHQALDRLIDSGAIVPKYMNLSIDDTHKIYGRVFRIGEGHLPTSQKILTLILLFENLKNLYGQDNIPAIVLEKYTVIALTNTFNFTELNEDGITGLGIRKKFSLFGARSFMVTDSDGNGVYTLDWAKDHKLLQQTDGEKYKLNKAVADQYLPQELGLSKTAKDKLEDIAHFCYKVSTKLNSDALVTITTLASKKEYWHAISAELFLWLNHPVYNIYNCLHKLEEIKNSTSANNNNLLDECNILLESNANFTAQVAKKSDLFKEYTPTIDSIEKAIIEDSNVSSTRVWRDIKSYLILKQNDSFQDCFLEEILTVLRVARQLTSLCRTLNNKAGYPIPAKLASSPKTLQVYLSSILKILDITDTKSESSLIIRNHFANKGIQNEIRHILIDFDENASFSVNFQKLRNLISKIADTCHSSFINFGIDPTKHVAISILNPPVYIVMWDMRQSTSLSDRIETETTAIFPINERIKAILSDKKLEDLVVTADDGNCFLTTNFNDVLSAFSIISKASIDNNLKFRIGCDVNFEGDLHVYTEKKIIAGRAYEYAARTTNFFKEISAYPHTWNGPVISEDPSTYLLLSEFVRRIAEANDQWNIPDTFELLEFSGNYTPRVKTGTPIPYKLFQLKMTLLESESVIIST